MSLKLLVISSATFLISLLGDAAAENLDHRQVWTGAVGYKIGVNSNPAAWWGIRAAIDIHKNNETADSEELREAFQNIRLKVNRDNMKRLSSDELAPEVWKFYEDVYSHVPGLAPAMQKYLKDSFDDFTIDENVVNSRNYYNHHVNVKHNEGELLGELYDLMSTDKTFRRVFDETFSGDFLPSAFNMSAEDILVQNPNFTNAKYVKEILELSRSGTQSLEKLESILNSGFDNTLKSLESKSSQLSEYHGTTQDKLEQISSGLAAMAKQREIQEIDRLNGEALKAGAFLVSTVLAEADARRLLATTNAILDTQRAVQQFAANRQLLSGNGKMNGASSIVLAGDIASIGLQLANSFSEVGPTSDQLIIENIKKLSEQVEKLGISMHQRFDILDERIEILFQNVSQSFTRLENLSRREIKDINDLKLTLSSVYGRIDGLDSKIDQYMDLILNSDFESKMRKCMFSRQIQGRELRSDEYDDCVNYILQYLADAKSPAVSGSWGANKDLLNSFEVLKDEDWAGNINYLIEMYSEMSGLQADPAIPNPALASVASHAYFTIASLNPSFFNDRPTTGLDIIVGELGAVRKRLLDLRRSDKLGIVFQRLFNDYISALNEVQSTAADIRNRVRDENNVLSTWLSVNELEKETNRIIEHYRSLPIENNGRPSNVNEVNAALDLLLNNHVKITHRDVIFSRVTDNSNFPPIMNSDSILYSLSKVSEIVAALALNPDSSGIDYSYAAIPRYSKGDLLWAVYGDPTISYTVFSGFGADGQKRYVAEAKSASKAGIFLWWDAPQCTGVGTSICPPPDPRQMIGDGLANSLLTSDVNYLPDLNAEELEDKLDKMLVAESGAIAEALLDEASPLSLSVSKLGGAVGRIRGLVTLLFPDVLRSNDRLRMILYGSPRSDACELIDSRIRRDIRLAPPAAGCDIGTYGVSFDSIYSPDVIASLVASIRDDSGEANPRLINAISLLQNLSTDGRAPLEELFSILSSDLYESSFLSDNVPWVEEEIAKLDFLRSTRH